MSQSFEYDTRGKIRVSKYIDHGKAFPEMHSKIQQVIDIYKSFLIIQRGLELKKRRKSNQVQIADSDIQGVHCRAGHCFSTCCFHTNCVLLNVLYAEG